MQIGPLANSVSNKLVRDIFRAKLVRYIQYSGVVGTKLPGDGVGIKLPGETVGYAVNICFLQYPRFVPLHMCTCSVDEPRGILESWDTFFALCSRQASVECTINTFGFLDIAVGCRPC